MLRHWSVAVYALSVWRVGGVRYRLLARFMFHSTGPHCAAVYACSRADVPRDRCLFMSPMRPPLSPDANYSQSHAQTLMFLWSNMKPPYRVMSTRIVATHPPCSVSCAGFPCGVQTHVALCAGCVPTVRGRCPICRRECTAEDPPSPYMLLTRGPYGATPCAFNLSGPCAPIGVCQSVRMSDALGDAHPPRYQCTSGLLPWEAEDRGRGYQISPRCCSAAT